MSDAYSPTTGDWRPVVDDAIIVGSRTCERGQEIQEVPRVLRRAESRGSSHGGLTNLLRVTQLIHELFHVALSPITRPREYSSGRGQYRNCYLLGMHIFCLEKLIARERDPPRKWRRARYIYLLRYTLNIPDELIFVISSGLSHWPHSLYAYMYMHIRISTRVINVTADFPAVYIVTRYLEIRAFITNINPIKDCSLPSKLFQFQISATYGIHLR